MKKFYQLTKYQQKEAICFILKLIIINISLENNEDNIDAELKSHMLCRELAEDSFVLKELWLYAENKAINSIYVNGIPFELQ